MHPTGENMLEIELGHFHHVVLAVPWTDNLLAVLANTVVPWFPRDRQFPNIPWDRGCAPSKIEPLEHPHLGRMSRPLDSAGCTPLQIDLDSHMAM